MRCSLKCLILAALLSSLTIPAAALVPGTDILVPAAVRAGTWVTDLSILNIGDSLALVDVYWLVRDQANPDPASRLYTLYPGEALVLEDVVHSSFFLDEGAGALRVVADEPLVVSARIYNLQDGATFGQGFEGVPRSMAVPAGGSTDIIGLASNDRFRTNLVAIDATGNGSRVVFTLFDALGNQLASRSWSLEGYEPKLRSAPSFFSGLSDFDYATLHAEVTSGSVIVVASKVDNDTATGDPTTLEAWSTACGSRDGTYQIVLYDSQEYGTGGFLKIGNDQVTYLKATYLNYDKGDPANPDCDLLFRIGGSALDTYSLADYASSVTFEQSFTGSGTLSLTFTFEVIDNHAITGTVDAVGSGFSGAEDGCNGTFPRLTLRGGKYDHDPEPPWECTPAWRCCKICENSQACGDSCIASHYTCHQPPGCACNDWEVCN